MNSNRPPIIVVLGHVDHGKTSLLDYVRKTSIVKKEKGGITQGIGASVVTLPNGKTLTFIDTPGHAAFSSMRSRGAKVADIAILIVGGDDGVKPQTKEALEHILAEGMPFVVAVTKIDLRTASFEAAQAQLEELGVLFEGRGGDVPILGISSVTGEGIPELLDLLDLIAEVREISGSPDTALEAVVIETSKDNRGLGASIIVRDGTIRVGDDIETDTTKARVRALFNSFNESVKEIGPGLPSLVLGFEELPIVGSRVWKILDGKPEIVKRTENALVGGSSENAKIRLVIKAANAGALEAILAGISKEVFVLGSGVGDVTESDVFLAKTGKAMIMTFESRAGGPIERLAKTEYVRIEQFGIIYELFDRIDALVKGETYEILGRGEIQAVFPFNNQKVAGTKVNLGRLKKGDSIVVLRGEKEVGEAKIISLRREKSDLLEAKQGEECGILLGPSLDFVAGDVIISRHKFVS